MVKLREILAKLSPELKYGEAIMNIELGNVDFDTFTDDEWIYIFSNTKNPNIKLRISDDFPFRVVLMKREGNAIHGTTWNGMKSHIWTEDDEEMMEKIWE